MSIFIMIPYKSFIDGVLEDISNIMRFLSDTNQILNRCVMKKIPFVVEFKDSADIFLDFKVAT